MTTLVGPQGLRFREVSDAAGSLLERGVLDAAFLDREWTRLRDEPADWTPDSFRARHFLSMYLPLRYWSWSRLRGQRDLETERSLGSLVVASEEYLWRSACAFRPPEPSAEGGTVFSLVLGHANPLRFSPDELGGWEENYRSALHTLDRTWRERPVWDPWVAMSLHAASFYLPVGLPLATRVDREDAPRRQLLVKLREHVDLQVVEVIGYWMESAALERDSGGLPIAAGHVARPLLARTPTEALILMEGGPS